MERAICLEYESVSLPEFIDCPPYNSCPHCNLRIHAKAIVVHNTDRYELVKDNHPHFADVIQEEKIVRKLVGYDTSVLYQCATDVCGKLFLVDYQSDISGFSHRASDSRVVRVIPASKVDLNVEVEIQKISPNFYSIYEQSFNAENQGLSQICGMGYRKALEFLIKDYVIFLNYDQVDFNEQKILAKNLGAIINQDISSQRIKDMASRATWLGNDETHYLRKWENKDVQDLRNIIQVVLHEMNMEILYRKTLEDMPHGIK
ncbi:DUF4145 domain-containing protein [Lysinibacillus xylanilyticus]|uniref:DUF4145 domain-containing protein n=1 Tax=Lysinibacillus xylanilyticus TaxID=582475 RepID=UPI00380312D3